MASTKRQILKRVKEKDIPKFQCQTCSKILADKASYQIHIQVHSDELPWHCELCSYRGKIKKYLSRHMRKVHSKAKGPQCTICNKVFHFTTNLKQHMRVHTGEKPYQCQVCGKAFSSTYCLKMHKLIHTNQKPYHCTFCEYACRDSSTLRRHQDRHLGIKPKTYNCLKCKNKYKTNELLKIHVDEVHRGLNTRQHPCDQCNKVFKTKSVLKMHIKRVHERTSETACDICDKVLSKYNMANHLLKHVDIRPFKCNFKGCGKRFKDQNGLKKHTLIHYPEYQIQCDLCDARFTRKFRFRAHKAKHFAENGYACDYCGITIHSKKALASHITKKHKHAQKFICDLCGIKTFNRKAITLHLKYGHGNQYDKTCKLCTKELESSKILKRHYLKLHNIKYTIQQSPEDIVVKDEPLEMNAEFEFNYDIQKVEIDAEPIPDPQYADAVSTLAYSKRVLEEDMSAMVAAEQPDEFDEFIQNVVRKNIRKEHHPEYADTETTLAYSKKVLEEDLSMVGYRQPDSAFDKFFTQQVMKKPESIAEKSKRKKPEKTKTRSQKQRKKARVDVVKLKRMKKTINKMLKDSKARREIAMLENMRRSYNIRIERAHHNANKKGPTQIKYFKKSAEQKIEHSFEKTQIDKTIPISEDIEQKQTNSDEDYENRLLEKDETPLNSNEKPKYTENYAKSNKIIEKKCLSNDELVINKVENDISTENEQVDELQNENTKHNNVDLPSGEENVVENDNHNNIIDETNIEYEAIHQSDDNISLNNKESTENLVLHDDILNHTKENISVDSRIGNNYQKILPNDDIVINIPVIDENNEYSHQTIPNDKETTGDRILDENLSLIDGKKYNIHEISQNDEEITEDRITDENVPSIDENNDIPENNDNVENNDNDEISQETETPQDTKRPKRNRNKKRIEYNENISNEREGDRNGKLKFLGHECYICFKIFKTKGDLKAHCYEHFNICNEQMLKKCPFCGYVTNRGIKNHIELYHNLNINYAYGQVTKKNDKYLFEIDDDCQLEIIPSISNLNRLAGIKMDEKNRMNKNVFLGKTKLVKKGTEWVVEKQAVAVSNEYILPEFTEEEYLQINIEGDTYCDRLKKLSFLAKKRGGKMLYPCSECEKLCQTLSALKLHNRKHEANPKKFKPKVWVNRHIEYTTAKKKSVRCSNKTIKKKKKIREEKKAQKEKPVKFIPVTKTVNTENRYAAPQPVKNKHKCDKKLIEFYKSNIKGGDIEFWQFLKIFNKMGRENVNDFDDLINRDDVHFGIHVKDNKGNQTVTENIVVEPDFVENESISNESNNTDKIPVKPKNTGVRKKNKNSKFTRAIMISRKEYLRRNEIKNEMRKRLAESQIK